MNLIELFMYGFSPEDEESSPITIYDDEDRTWKVIKDLYSSVLHKDKRWHFFCEGSYNVIRFQKKFFVEVEKFLDDANVVYECDENTPWVDSSATVNKHKKVFEGLFHNFSLMAMEEYEDSPWAITNLFDRVAHCFLNHQNYNLKNTKKQLSYLWESKIISANAIGRAEFVGQIVGRQLAIKEREKESLCHSSDIQAEKQSLENT